MPVVLIFHGGGGGAAKGMQRISHFDSIADRGHFTSQCIRRDIAEAGLMVAAKHLPTRQV
jgi:hypothetical protein